MAWIAMVGEDETNNGDINKVPLINEFLDVFPKELPRLPPNWKVEFTIDLLLGMEPISILLRFCVMCF